MSDPAPGGVRVEPLHNGTIWRVILATPRANILDGAKVDALTKIFVEAAGSPDLKAIILEADGPHFSFGASVEEHLPGAYPAMLARFHGLFHTMLAAAVPTLSAVQGQCLGGALELVSFTNRVFASPCANLGQPEIVLGVFAPVASVFLLERVGRSRAEDLCLSGRSIPASDALVIGLVDVIAVEPKVAAHEYAREYFLPRSASSLRLATRAVRAGLTARFAAELERVEHIYKSDLMSTRDAVEGLTAFVEKRAPQWGNA